VVTVRLRAPLSQIAGKGQMELDGATVGEVLRALELAHPKITGWIQDEQGRVRRNVNVFVNGERSREDSPLAGDEVIQVLPSISGGMR
jgi:sulfur-carrier protein